MSEKLLFNELKPGHIVLVDVEGEGKAAKFTFTGEPKSELPDTPAEAVTLAKGSSAEGITAGD